MALLVLKYPLDSEHHLESARPHKQNKVEYQHLLAELDHLDFLNLYETLDISARALSAFLSVKNLLNLWHFIHPDLPLPKATVQQMLDTAAKKCISASQRIFMAWKCSECMVISRPELY